MSSRYESAPGAAPSLYDETDISRMERAVEEAWYRLSRAGHPACGSSVAKETRRRLSSAVLEATASGNVDADKLADYAIRRLHDF